MLYLCATNKQISDGLLYTYDDAQMLIVGKPIKLPIPFEAFPGNI